MVHDSDHRGGLLRAREGGEQRVTPLELFFDLVFVFAVTQLSYRLLDHLTVRGALETLMLLLVVWGAWVYTSWFTNWFHPNRLAGVVGNKLESRRASGHTVPLPDMA